MAAPTAYTENALAAYMASLAGDVGTALGWTVDAGSYDEAVNETILAYGVDDIADATDIAKLRSLARVMFWRAAMSSAAGRYDFSADGGSYSRSQLHAMAKEMLAVAEADASEYLDSYSVQAVGIGYDDYYPEYDEDLVEW